MQTNVGKKTRQVGVGGKWLVWGDRKHKTATALHTENLSREFNVDWCNITDTKIERDLRTFSQSCTINESQNLPKIQILVYDFEGEQIIVGTPHVDVWIKKKQCKGVGKILLSKVCYCGG